MLKLDRHEYKNLAYFTAGSLTALLGCFLGRSIRSPKRRTVQNIKHIFDSLQRDRVQFPPLRNMYSSYSNCSNKGLPVVSKLTKMSNVKSAYKIFGLGIDVAHIPRFKGILARHEDRFLRRAFHPNEIIEFQKCSSSTRMKYIASRWAAKEAVYKAFGSHRIPFPDICVYKTVVGEPRIKLYGKAKDVATDLDINNTLVSISHDGEYAFAEALLIQK
eukprot:GSMAST32.ASY1.ANO1.1099.1 assembled CDS